jgi:hypothetical protein
MRIACMKIKLSILISIFLCLTSLEAVATQPLANKPWSILLYRSVTATQTFGNLIMGKYNSFGEDLYTAELAYNLDQKNIISRFFHPIIDTTGVAVNYTYRHDYRHSDNVDEFNLYALWHLTCWPYFLGHGAEFPWNKYVNTTFGVGWGFSYDTHPPYADQEPGFPASDFNRLLNYLALEATFALPTFPQLQLVGRLHHRCTMWGLYPGKRSAGSTSAGIGLRLYF